MNAGGCGRIFAIAHSLHGAAAARSRISVDLPEATRRRLRMIAPRRDLTQQEYVRRAVDDPVLAELWSNEADAVYDDL